MSEQIEFDYRDTAPAPEPSNLENMAMFLNQVRDECYGRAHAAGWWTDLNTGEPLERNFGEMVALMHSELSEALEAHRKGLNDSHLSHRNGMEVEFADTIIRIMDACGRYGWDIGGAVAEKLVYNSNRADHKIENRMKADGKKF